MTFSKKTWYGIICATVVVLFLITGMNIRGEQKAQKEYSMIYQLKQLRDAVQIYRVTNKALPPELKASLVVTKDGKVVPIQWAFKKDATGNPVDPFGAPYVFNAKNGWVSSKTPGYESW